MNKELVITVRDRVNNTYSFAIVNARNVDSENSAKCSGYDMTGVICSNNNR